MAYELVQKASFLKDFMNLDRGVQGKAQRAVAALEFNPYGGNCKRILKKQYQNLYRYRIGDHRLLYCVGNECVGLLAIGPRDRIYARLKSDPRGGGLPAHPPKAGLVAIPTVVDDEPLQEPPEGGDASGGEEWTGPAAEPSHSLVSELLVAWGVPDEDIPKILACKHADEIIDLDISEHIKERLLHLQAPPTVQQVIEEPDLELPRPGDLGRYAEGSLRGFLLRLDSEQRKAASRFSRGPVLVKGGPGTGKSIVALHRIRDAVLGGEQEGLFESPPSVIFLTYTNALTNVSRQLLGSLLGPKRLESVRTMTLDRVASKLASSDVPAGRPHTKALEEFVEQARQRVDAGSVDPRGWVAAGALGPAFLLDEFEWVIDGRGLTEVEQYLRESRSGRRVRLDGATRTAVWRIYEEWRRLLSGANAATYTQVQAAALRRAAEWRAQDQADLVVVDEAQDLKPVGLRLAMALSRSPEGFYITADEAQCIYGRGFSWRQAAEDLRIQGRTVILKNNYRSTQQIQSAVERFRAVCGLESEDGRPAVRSGPCPVVQKCATEEAEALAVRDHFMRWAEELGVDTAAGAVVVRSARFGSSVAEHLTRVGLDARYVKSSELDLDSPFVKVMTIHAAKGLEFPMVAVCGVNRYLLPLGRFQGQSDEEYADVLLQEQRLFLVAMSRAMRRLLVTCETGRASDFALSLEPPSWQVIHPAPAAGTVGTREFPR